MKHRSFFMVLVGLLVAALALGACTPAEPQVVEKIVKETVIVEKEVVVDVEKTVIEFWTTD